MFFHAFLSDIPALPEELKNEPFTFEDSGYRPEVTSRRDIFEFDAGTATRRPSCKVGHKRIHGEFNHARDKIPEKSTTNISVATVYDTYGLAIAYSYLKRLYGLSRYSEWILVYLRGSVLALGMEEELPRLRTRPSDHILYLCVFLCVELGKLDAAQPKMIGSLEEVPEGTLPADVLSLIIGSQRVSKEIASDVQRERCARVLNSDELRLSNAGNLRVRGLATKITEQEYTLVSPSEEQWSLKEDGGRFLLTYSEQATDVDSYLHGDIVNYPLVIFMDVYRRRGCDPRGTVVNLLSMIRRSSIELWTPRQVAGWLLVLSYELNTNKEDIVFPNLFSVGEELDELIEAAIQKYGN